MIDRIVQRAKEIAKNDRGLVMAFEIARHEVEAQEGRRLTDDERWELGDRFDDVLEEVMGGRRWTE